MAKVQLYGRNDKRLDKKAVNTSFKRKLMIFKVILIISMISNVCLIVDKYLK